jgi:Flp pilus assembly pilin Flp
LLVREEGQDLIEYALLVSLIALVSLLALNILGFEIWANWNTLRSTLTGVA